MTILARYTSQIFLRLFGLCCGAFASIYLVIDILEKLGKFTRTGGEFTHIAMFFIWKLPEIATQIIPLAVLMATLLTLGTLARTSELTAMRSSGAGLLRITAPLLLIAIILSLLNLAMTEIVVPKSYEKMRYIREVQISKKSPAAFFRQGAIWYRDNGDILQAKLFDPAASTLKGVTIWKLDNSLQPLERLNATDAMRQADGWLLKGVVQHRYSSGTISATRKFTTLPVPIQLSVVDLKVVGKQAENMGFSDLRRYCRKLEQGGYDTTRYRTLLHTKLASPCSPIVMALLGIPFALRGSRSSGPAIGIGMSLVIGLAYFIINAFLVSFGQAGALPPPVAAWAANLLFSAFGIWLALTLD